MYREYRVTMNQQKADEWRGNRFHASYNYQLMRLSHASRASMWMCQKCGAWLRGFHTFTA